MPGEVTAPGVLYPSLERQAAFNLSREDVDAVSLSTALLTSRGLMANFATRA